MKLLFHPSSLKHETGNHPESGKRLLNLPEVVCPEISFDESIVGLVHTKEYQSKVKEYSSQALPLDADTITSLGSYEAAIYAANLAIYASETGDFALIRPPGHHAYPSRASGFCLFNNVAIAAQQLVNQGKKVLIIDFDGHCGDGTSEIFYGSAQVMVVSIHEYPAFPGKGREEEIGEGVGEGFTIHATLPPYSGDDIFLDTMKSLMPIFKQFNPDVVGFSAGFDGHQNDPLLDLRYSKGLYYKIGRMFREEFKNCFAVLEGGYEVEALHQCIQNFTDGMNGGKISFDERATDSEIMVWNEYEIRHDHLLKALKKYWNI